MELCMYVKSTLVYDLEAKIDKFLYPMVNKAMKDDDKYFKEALPTALANVIGTLIATFDESERFVEASKMYTDIIVESARADIKFWTEEFYNG